jgi:hypothetical protein
MTAGKSGIPRPENLERADARARLAQFGLRFEVPAMRRPPGRAKPAGKGSDVSLDSGLPLNDEKVSSDKSRADSPGGIGPRREAAVASRLSCRRDCRRLWKGQMAPGQELQNMHLVGSDDCDAQMQLTDKCENAFGDVAQGTVHQQHCVLVSKSRRNRNSSRQGMKTRVLESLIEDLFLQIRGILKGTFQFSFFLDVRNGLTKRFPGEILDPQNDDMKQQPFGTILQSLKAFRHAKSSNDRAFGRDSEVVC